MLKTIYETHKEIGFLVIQKYPNAKYAFSDGSYFWDAWHVSDNLSDSGGWYFIFCDENGDRKINMHEKCDNDLFIEKVKSKLNELNS